MSALEAAYDDLVRRVRAADRAGDWRERSILEPLASVADYVKRIGDHGDSAHYRAGKSGALVAAALRVEREAFLAYARSLGRGGQGDEESPTEAEVYQTVRVLDAVATAAHRALWAVCRTGLTDLPVEVLRRAGERFDADVDARRERLEGNAEGGAW